MNGGSQKVLPLQYRVLVLGQDLELLSSGRGALLDRDAVHA